jgi:cytochrome P450
MFWALCQVLADSHAYQKCLTEVKSVANKRCSDRKWFTLDELDEMQTLDSAFQETLRMYSSGFAARYVRGSFMINPKESKGPKIMIQEGTPKISLPNIMHYDPEIFEEPEKFKYDRFLDPLATTKEGFSSCVSFATFWWSLTSMSGTPIHFI